MHFAACRCVAGSRNGVLPVVQAGFYWHHDIVGRKMKSEEEIRADFWTQKVNWLKNVLRYGAPAFSLDELYQALLQGGWTSDQVARTTTRSFFGTPCPTLQMSLCKENDVYVIQNPGIGTMELTIQECKEPVSLTGASVASVVSMLQTYCSHFGHPHDASGFVQG